MGGRRLTNLARRKGVYYFRGFLPQAAHPFARRREFRVSLRTKDTARARARLRPIALAFESLCGQLRTMMQAHAPDQDIYEAVRTFGRALLKNAAPPPTFEGPTADYELALAKFWTEEEVGELEHAIDSRNFNPVDPETPILSETRRYADTVRQELFGATELSPERLGLLRLGIARAQLEERQHFRRRLEDAFAPLVVADPLFGPAAPASALPKGGPTFSAAADLYTKAKSGIVWTSRTEEENRRILRLAAEHFGANTPISAITLDNVRAFRDSVIAWRRKPKAAASLADISNAPPSDRIRAKSAAKYFGYVSANSFSGLAPSPPGPPSSFGMTS